MFKIVKDVATTRLTNYLHLFSTQAEDSRGKKKKTEGRQPNMMSGFILYSKEVNVHECMSNVKQLASTHFILTFYEFSTGKEHQF